MNKTITILHYAAPPIIGGVESTIYHHALELHRLGYAVRVLTGRGGKFHPDIPVEVIAELDSRHPAVLAVGQELAQGIVSERFKSLRERLQEQLTTFLSASQVCIAHNVVTLHKNLPLTAALHRLTGQPGFQLLAWCHDFAWKDELYTADLHPGYPWDLLRQTWPGTRYVVVSQDRQKTFAELLDMPPESMAVVTPGVNPQSFLKLEDRSQAIIERANLWEANPMMLLPARITRRKNIELAIAITGKLVQSRPEAKLVISGPPGAHNPSNQAYLDRLKDLTAQLDLGERVVFLYEFGASGEPLYVSDAMMADLYQIADLLLFPSRREGFGIPVLEAGLSRIPVFAADIPPVHESGGQWVHFFDPDGDPAQITSRILAVLDKNDSYQLRKRVIRQYTWRAIVMQQIIPLIEEVI